MKKINNLKKALVLATFTITSLLLVSCNFDQNSTGTKDLAEDQNEEKFDNSRQEQDGQFLVNTAEHNLKEIQYGQLAQQKGRTSHVKELGKMMEDAHTKSQRELIALAKSKNISIPTSPTNEVKETYNMLNDKSEDDFDEAYTDRVVNMHNDAIDAFEKVSTNSEDSDVRGWAIKTLPQLRKHLNHSQECQQKLDEM